MKAPSEPVVSTADPIVTVAIGTACPEASTTFPNRVKTGRVVVVVDNVVVVEASATVAGGTATALVVGPPTSEPTHPNTEIPRIRKVGKRSLDISLTPAWYGSGPA
jgi:hypothetical protein